MKFATLTSVVLFGFVINHAIRRSNHIIAEQRRKFWEREHQANHTPPKSIDDLAWITIPSSLPLCVPCSDQSALSQQATIISLSHKKIVNLNRYSNTDLKLAYGTSNIDTLSNADANYLVLIRTLDSLAHIYENEGHTKEWAEIIQFAIDCESERPEHFLKLANYYLENDNLDGLHNLIERADLLPMQRREVVMPRLSEYLDLMEIVND